MRSTLSHKFPLRCVWNSPNVRLIDDGPLSSFQRSSSASSFHVSLLQVIDGVMSLALCPQVVSQAPQHFRSSGKQAICEGCFARNCICSVISLHSGMSRAVHPQELSQVDVALWHIPVWDSYYTFHFLEQTHWTFEDDTMCGLTVTSWGNPMEGMGDWFHLHCQAGGWDCIGCSLHGWQLHLAWQWSSTLSNLVLLSTGTFRANQYGRALWSQSWKQNK